MPGQIDAVDFYGHRTAGPYQVGRGDDDAAACRADVDRPDELAALLNS